MTTIVEDIDAYLAGEVSGIAQAEALLQEARAEIERLAAIAMGREVAIAHGRRLTEMVNRAAAADGEVTILPVVRVERHDVPTPGGTP